MTDSDKRSLTKYCIPKVLKMYPGLLRVKSSDYGFIRLEDTTVTELVFIVSEFGQDIIYLKTYCNSYSMTLSLEYPVGELTIVDSKVISDASCVKMFDLNIDIRFRGHECGKLRYCDKNATIRRNTIYNIINDNGN